MFRQRTTIIVGAGASCELGLPSGEGLKKQIMTLLSPTRDNFYGFTDPVMIEFMKAQLGPHVWERQDKLEPIKAAAERIRRGLPLALSIDNFLHTHQGDVEVERLGKFAIALLILRAEIRSHLFARKASIDRLVETRTREPNFTITSDELNASWYPPFAQLLMSQIQRQDIASAFTNLKFIVFNYDRCLEQYLFLALQAYFDIEPSEAAEVLSNVDFIHPYGSLGPLPWQSNGPTVPFGTNELPDYNQMIDRIRTFTESVKGAVASRVGDAVAQAETLLILGFGYLDQNIQLLRQGNERQAQRIISSAYGVAEPDLAVMRTAMSSLGNIHPVSAMIEQGTCRDLFDHYRLQLSLA